MDYGTFFFTNTVSVTVFTVCIFVLAWYDPRVTGMRWFAGAQVVGVIKLVLQGMEGKVPAIFSAMTANELYLISIAMQWMGIYWFVVRKPFRYRLLWIPVGIVLAAYTFMYLAKIPYTGNVINLPFVALCGFSAWTLWRHRTGQFAAVAHIGTAIVFAQMCVAAFRAVLTNLRYIFPWKTVDAQSDPLWLYSLAAAAFFAACMAMCEMWFLMTELHGELDRRARIDLLTGALNRSSMQEAAIREIKRSRRYGNSLSVIIIDIDNFKQLNDTRGHAAGDCALRALVDWLHGILRQQDSLARIGGDEFAILLQDTSGSAALKTAERVRQAVADLEIEFETGPIRMTICAGVAQVKPERGWEDMMRRADAALFVAKRLGRNRVAAEPGLADPFRETCGAELDRPALLPAVNDFDGWPEEKNIGRSTLSGAG
jgi:diguanylate cyclase (GGDEF)-like protein